MGDLRNNFADRVRVLRKASDLTQQQLADKAGMDYKHLGSIERREKNLTIDNVEKIAKGLGVEAHQLFLFTQEVLKPEGEVLEDKVFDLFRLTDLRTKRRLLPIIKAVLGLREG